MSWDGSGTFSRTNGSHSGTTTWQQDKAAGDNILSSRHDTHDQDLATGINNCLTKDGQNYPSANLPMNSKKHTGVAAGTARTDYADVASVQDGSYRYAADTGAADAYVITLSPAITAYAAGQKFVFKAANTNTTTSTLNVNTLGAKTLKKNFGANDLVAGDIVAGGIYQVVYDGTNFQISTVSDNGLYHMAEKTTPVDADMFGITDSAASPTANILKKLSWANIKATAKTYFDTLYQPIITTLGVSNGGTGLSSTTAYAVLCGGTTSAGALQPVASVGTSGQVLTSNGAGALPTFQTASGGMSFPQPITSYYYFGGNYVNYAVSDLTVTSNTLYGTPFIVPVTSTFTKIGFSVGTAAAAKSVRVGIYSMGNGLASQATLVLDCGTVSVGTTGDKEIAISQSLAAGRYFLAFVSDGTPSVKAAAAVTDKALGALIIGGTASSTGGVPTIGAYGAFTYGALPSTFTFTTVDTTSYHCWLRR